jgi:hypothetical protein
LRRTLRSYFAYYPAFPNPFGVGQGRSGVENPGEARMRAHRRDSSTWRTPSPIPAPRRLGMVRRCPRLWFPISCRGLANQRRVFASQDRIPSRPTNCSLHSLLCDPEHVSSLPQGCLHQPLRQGWSCTDEVFSNDRSGLFWRVAVEPDFDVQVAQRTHLHRRKRGPPAPSLCDRSRT